MLREKALLIYLEIFIALFKKKGNSNGVMTEFFTWKEHWMQHCGCTDTGILYSP